MRDLSDPVRLHHAKRPGVRPRCVLRFNALRADGTRHYDAEYQMVRSWNRLSGD